MSIDPKMLITAAIFQAGEPLSLDALKRLFFKEECPSKVQLLQYIEEIKKDYSEGPVELKEIASGYRFKVSSEYSEPLTRLQMKKPPKYTRATLETLSLIIYKQPITRGEIEQVRGVAVSSSIIKTLQEREWIQVVGYRDVPGRPAMFATTKKLLDYFDLASLEDFPPLDEVVDLEEAAKELTQQLSLNVDPTDDDLAITVDQVNTELDVVESDEVVESEVESGEAVVLDVESEAESGEAVVLDVESEDESDELSTVSPSEQGELETLEVMDVNDESMAH